MDKTLANNIKCSGITDPVFNAIKKYKNIQVYKVLNIIWIAKIYSSRLYLKRKIGF